MCAPRFQRWGNGGKPMPALQRTKRLPRNFEAIDPNAPFDVQRFFTALDATGNTRNVLYSIDDDKVSLIMDIGIQITKLQEGRLATLFAWERNKDPKREQQIAFARKFVGFFSFAPRTEADA